MDIFPLKNISQQGPIWHTLCYLEHAKLPLEHYSSHSKYIEAKHMNP